MTVVTAVHMWPWLHAQTAAVSSRHAQNVVVSIYIGTYKKKKGGMYLFLKTGLSSFGLQCL